MTTIQLQTVLLECVAGHFEGARIEDNRVVLPATGLVLDCALHQVRELSSAWWSASLFFYLSGGMLGDAPLFASISGYGSSPPEAVATGACNWMCVFGKMLDHAFRDLPQETADSVELTIRGRRYRMIVDGLDRAMAFREGANGMERVREVREHLGGTPWLLPGVATSDAMPILPADRSALLGLFVFDAPDQRTVEVKVNGSDWPALHAPLASAPFVPGDSSALMRELALLIPLGPDTLTRDAVEATLRGACVEVEGGRPLRDWRGFHAHAGALGAPASEADLMRLEADVGALPADYRALLRDVQTSGAGPGYGLVSPFHPAQTALAQARFGTDDVALDGVLLLAHAGCGVVYLLVLRGPEAGQVWVDARGSSGGVSKVSDSVSAWYRAWLDAVVRNDRTHLHWDHRACATPHVLSQVLASFEQKGASPDDARSQLAKAFAPRGIVVSTSGSAFFASGESVDPCQGCVELTRSLGIDEVAFTEGVLPQQARPQQGSFWSRMTASFRGRPS